MVSKTSKKLKQNELFEKGFFEIMPENHIFLDCEASSLSEASFPIEIAHGDSLDTIKSYLIAPNLYPCGYTDWSEKSEKVHGLSREYLNSNGEAPRQVAEALNNSLSGKVVYSDSPTDDFWLKRLFWASKIERQFELKHIDELLMRYLPFDWFQPQSIFTATQYYNLCDEAREACGLDAHRAANDVAYLIELYRLSKEKAGYI